MNFPPNILCARIAHARKLFMTKSTTFFGCLPRVIPNAAILLGLTVVLASSAMAVPPSGVPPTIQPAVTNDADITGPKIKFSTPIYDFGRVSSGEPVTHTYYFTNTGTETLFVTNVAPSCGCTTTGEWSRQVEPGQTGQIPMKFNSANYGGAVTKSITVTSNAKNQPAVFLQLKGTVWKAIDVVPAYAILTVTPDAGSASTTIRLTNNTDKPLVLSAPQVSNTNFSAILKTNEPGKSFEVVISTVPPLKPGSLQGQVRIPTSVTNVSTVTITTWANVQPAVSVMPAQLTLPQGPLANKLTPIVTVINNTTNPLTVSEPSVTLTNVDIQFKEVQAGKYFTATLTFPPGFELPQGQPAEFTLKSSNPKFSLIKVPVVQMKRPVLAPQQPASQQARNPAFSSARHVLPRPAGQLSAPPLPVPTTATPTKTTAPASPAPTSPAQQ